MKGSVRIGSVFGIPVYLHFSLLLIIPVFAVLIGSQIEFTAIFLEDIFGLSAPIDLSLVTGTIMRYLLGLFVALSLFVGVLLHELGHAVVAQRGGIEVERITLFILGGLAQIGDMGADPKQELPTALAGPFTSLLIGVICCSAAFGALHLISNPAWAGLIFYILGYLGFLNIVLFLFNLIPAFPMDGGRVLRALLARKMPITKATQIAAEIGRIFAVLFGIVAFILLSPILIIIAVFIYIAAGQEAEMTKTTVLLEGVTVQDAMSAPVVTVEKTRPLHEIIDQMNGSHHLGFPVVERGRLIGMITLADLHKAPPVDREALQVKDVMSTSLHTILPTEPLRDAMMMLSKENIGRIPVVSTEGTLVGIVTRSDIFRVIELRGV